MLFKDLNVPDAVIAAQETGTLAIFAGAGVSIMSGLPKFEKLSEQIVASEIHRLKVEPLDQFLERATATQGIDVYRRTRDILQAASQQPNELHTSLLQAFYPRPIRLVTTNFDSLFSLAAEALLSGEERPRIYYAPALPLGDDFDGIVYLHGAVEHDYRGLVLTAADFGKAYMTKGWARRFLEDMFGQYTVLFVGYSHNDVMMSYLARSLPPAARDRRFALVEKGQSATWETLNVGVSEYDARDNHRVLVEGLQDWAKLARATPYEVEVRVKTIVEKPPPIDPSDADFIASVLRDRAKVEYFTRHAGPLPDEAQPLAWLEWAEQQPSFLALFQTDREIYERVWPQHEAAFSSFEAFRQIMTHLATWFADKFICDYPDESLLLVLRHNQTINPILWRCVADHLWHCDHRPQPGALNKWLLILLRQAPAETNTLLEYNMHKWLREDPQYLPSGFVLFKHLLYPQPELRRGLRYKAPANFADAADFEIGLSGDDHWIEKAWDDTLSRSIQLLMPELESVVTSYLRRAHELLNETNRLTSTTLSYWLIEIPSVADGRPRVDRTGIGVLVGISRDLIDWVANNEPGESTRLANAWLGTGVPLLRRLATYGMTEATAVGPDQKIAWAINNNLLLETGLWPEVTRLVRRTYGVATRSARDTLIDAIKRELTRAFPDDRARELTYGRLHSLLELMCEADPSDSLSARLREALEKEMPTLKPVESPRPQLPSVEGLLKLSPSKKIEWLLTFLAPDEARIEREDFLRQVEAAVSRDFAWGARLARALVDKNQTDGKGLWRAVFRGWLTSISTQAQVLKAIGFPAKVDAIRAHDYELTTFLYELIEKRPELLSARTLLAAESLARALWVDNAVRSGKAAATSDDWLFDAINSPGGKLALFWLHACEKAAKEIDADSDQLSSKYKENLARMIRGDNNYVAHARTVVCSQIHFLLRLDGRWARSDLLPFFSSTDGQQAQQAWHGFLGWGRLTPEIITALRPAYIHMARHLADESQRMRARFMEHIAVICIHGPDNPLADRWLNECLKGVKDTDRVRWANQINFFLSKLSDDQKKKAWDGWIDTYWNNRISGIPMKLGAPEVAAMAEWAASLEPVFSKVVERTCESPPPIFRYTSLFHRLIELDAARKHADPTARLVLHLIQDERVARIGLCPDLELLTKSLIDAGAPEDKLRRICKALSKLGCRAPQFRPQTQN